MSTVRRVNRPADQFVMVSNTFARDERLSLEAIGLGLWLLSHVAGWETSVKAICTRTRTGRDRVNRILTELGDAGYLRRTQERDEYGRMAAMTYEIQCTPFDDETPGGTGSLKSRQRVSRQRPTGTHKKSTSKKTINPEKQDSSGGQTADAAAPGVESSSTPEPEAPVTQSALFDLTPAKGAGKPGPEPSAGTVVAAYVESFKKHHGGSSPAKSQTGRVARDAKALLGEGKSGPQELADAARLMGEGIYNNLAVGLDIFRRRGQHTGRKSGRPATPHTDPHWVQVEKDEEHQWYQDLLHDDDAIRWARRDPSEVARLIELHPDLAARFQAVA